MKRFITLLILVFPAIPLAHGCHREDDDIRTRWFTIYTFAAPLAACWFRRGRSNVSTTPNVPITRTSTVARPVSTRSAA